MFQKEVEIGGNRILMKLPNRACVACMIYRMKLITALDNIVGSGKYAKGVLIVNCESGMKIRGAINGKGVELK